MAPNRPIVRRVVQHLEAIQALRPLISRNTVVCLNNQDLNQPDLWLTSSLQASSLASKAVMVARQLSHQASIRIHRWGTGVPPAPVATAVVLSSLQMLSGLPLQPKTLGTDLVATKDNQHMMPMLPSGCISCIASPLQEFGTSSPGAFFLVSVSVSPAPGVG